MNNAFPLQENSKTDCEKCNLSLVTPKWNHLAKKFDLKSLKALSPKSGNVTLQRPSSHLRTGPFSKMYKSNLLDWVYLDYVNIYHTYVNNQQYLNGTSKKS